MHIKTHDKAYSVVMEDGSEWKIWPADIAATLQWEPSSDLEVQEIDDEPCTHAIVDRAHGLASASSKQRKIGLRSKWTRGS